MIDPKKTNIGKWMQELCIDEVKKFHQWTVNHYEDFWLGVIDKLGIVLQKNPNKICDLTAGLESPNWLPGAKLNIVESCFTAAASKTAILYKLNGALKTISYGELERLCNRIANSLLNQGFKAKDAIAIDMPMTMEAVAIYLGIIKMGGIVVSIADSFSAEEIATRLQIAKTKAIFTQDFILRGEKKLPLYEKVVAAQSPLAIVIRTQSGNDNPLRKNDLDWNTFLVTDDNFSAQSCDPMDACNILFSSGTTGIPKAIPWNQTTPIKAAADAFSHQNIQENDVVCWPTNLGWMMGPWLIFAALINHATIALFDDVPKDRSFGEFVQDAKVTMLGLVPTLVAGWHQSHCMEGLNWESIKVFSSTGECSNPNDMAYLMGLAGNKPVIEYCGGTEIGGAYISSTVIEKNYPSLCSTPTMGLDFVLLDEQGHINDEGEVAIIPPSIGLSTQILNGDQHEIYYANLPKLPDGKILRRHGDHIKRLENGYYRVLGRVDDTMNLGGIKISSAEIESAIVGIENIIETAAIAVSLQQGPSLLVIYAASEKNNLDKEMIKQQMQSKINKCLNPLFKIYDVVIVKALPKTASNKIMRKTLRKNYQESSL